MNMKERMRAKFQERQEAQRLQQFARQPRRQPRPRHASREEQRGRYLDCGPQAWDDR